MPNDLLTDAGGASAELAFSGASWAPPSSVFVLTTTVPAMKSCNARLFSFVSMVRTSATNHKPGRAVRSQNGLLATSGSPSAMAFGVELPVRMANMS